MPDTHLTLYTTGGLANAQWGVPNYVPDYYYGENCRFNLVLFSNGGYPFLPAGGVTLSVALGQTDQGPARGEWAIANNGATGSAVSFNATTTQLLNSISSICGLVNITTYGSTISAGYIITAVTKNTSLNITGTNLSLTPSSTVQVSTLVTASSNVAEQKLVRLRRNPALSTTRYLNKTDFEYTTISASGPSAACGPWYINIPDDSRLYPELITLNVSLSGSVTSTATELFTLFYTNVRRDVLVDRISGGATVKGAVRESLESVGYSNVSSAGGYVAAQTSVCRGQAFYGNKLGDFVQFAVVPWTDKGIKITANPVTSSIITSVTIRTNAAFLYANGYYDVGTVTFSGTNLDEEFREAKSDKVTLTLEINLIANDKTTTLLQAPATIRKTIS